MGRDQEGVEFTRRRFTLPPRLDTRLETLANENYQGNVSLCLRAAIEDHRNTLSGAGPKQVGQRIVTRVEELSTRQQKLLAEVEAIKNDVATRSDENRRAEQRGFVEDEVQQQVNEVLVGKARGLRIEDLTEQLDEPSSRIIPAVGTLVDTGHVAPTGDSPQRYRLVGYSARDARGESE